MLYDIFLTVANAGLLAGYITLALLVLRPVLLRLFTAQQRAVIWLVVWNLGYFPLNARGGVLPVTFQDLIAVRTGSLFGTDPAFLPPSYEGAGVYHIALPGDVLIPVTLNDALMKLLPLIWLAVGCAMVGYFIYRGQKLTTLVRAGRKLAEDDPLCRDIDIRGGFFGGYIDVWVAPGLPTSFVRGGWGNNEIAIQAELPFEVQRLVLLHERRHVALWHPWWKVIATINLVMFWWNPLVWVGFRYFCRDLELACDASVLKRLPAQERKQYAETLVELGQGAPLWEIPLAFGECDTAVRVKSLVKWKPRHILLSVMTWGMAVLVTLFFYGGHRQTHPAADLMLAFERDYGGTVEFAQQLNDGMAKELDLIERYGVAATPAPDLGITQVWEGPDEDITREIVSGFDREKGILYKTSTVTYPSLWVETAGGWHQVYYIWWGAGSNTFHVAGVKVCEEPDLREADCLVGGK